jgi:YgiT-type zinc finger domain-containing protein
VDNAHTKEAIEMRCSLEGCPGEYEERKIVHTVRHKGQVTVIDHVPAEVCSMCGDVLLTPETVRRIEVLLQRATLPAASVPLYEYA